MSAVGDLRFVLASASPARLATLRTAGIDPAVHVSGVDESGVTAASPAEVATTLARLKGESVWDELAWEERGASGDLVLVGCDSVLDLDGVALGKPYTDDEARRRWREMRGRSGVLVTGHHVIVARGGEVSRATRAVSTVVHFADLSDAEIDAYVATGEPHQAAGAFTIDGFGAAFVTGIEGDPHNVVVISVQVLREMLASLGVSWTGLWSSNR